MTALLGMDALEDLDARLVGLGSSGGALRLALGRGLEALAQQGGHHELGFSSVEAYALERCERSSRWVQESRALARRLESLPRTSAALASGRLTWTATKILSRVPVHAPEDETRWLDLADRCTVRELGNLANEARRATAADETRARHPESEPLANTEAPASTAEPFRTLTITVDHADGWLFEAARRVADHVGGAHDADAIVEALLAEGFTTVQPWLPRNDPTSPAEPEADPAAIAQRAWEAQRKEWRDEAEVMCERRWHSPRGDRELASGGGAVGDESSVSLEPSFEGTPEELDAELRAIALRLGSRDLVMGQIAEAFWKADGWRRLGYATEAQYARERVGQSLSSLKAKRALARHVLRAPLLGRAIEQGEVGYEAARLVASVADTETIGRWIERAKVRTIRHLREEVDAVRLLASLESRPMLPPSEELMHEVEALESRILSGEVLGAGPEHDAPASVTGVPSTAGAGGQTSALGGSQAARVHAASVTLRLRVREGTYRWYRWLERRFTRRFGRRTSFFRFLCLSLLETWKPALGAKGAFGTVYVRDRYRCQSPVCARRDVTPHHLVLRAHGGDDSDENMLSLCVWCHLHGIHEGRLAAERPAKRPRFRLGRLGHTLVHGRRRERRGPA